MSRPTPATGSDRLLHCSLERTLFVTSDGGRTVVCKLFVRGALADAEQEAAIGRELAGLDIARYLGARLDPATNSPCVLLDWHEGQDLDHVVARSGAVPAARAAELLVPVARTLAAMHAHRGPSAPAGYCHGDIKPGNLLATATTTLVLDLEHAAAINPTAAAGEPGPVHGTGGFAAPEARHGAAPSPALDVYGLGATLRWLLTGAGLARLPQDRDLHELVRACMAEDPNARPAAASIAERLATIARRLQNDSDEEILGPLAAGERLEFVSDSPRHAELQRFAARQRRLRERFPELLQIPDGAPSTPAATLRALHHVQRALRHFPRQRNLLTWRRRLTACARDLLAATASRVSGLQRDERHDDAAHWLDDSLQLTRALLLVPGREPIPGAPDPRTVGLLQRDPLAFLRRLQDQLADARAELATATSAIDSAEQELDLDRAEAAIDAMAERYGGASPTAARRRDQLHRLRFFCERIALGLPSVERLAQTWDRTALDPLLGFVTECARAIGPANRPDVTTPLGLRSLQVTLVNLAEELPHLYVRSGPAHDALTSALEHTSDRAAELVAEASKQLESVPVPVRPLQITLGRLDSFRILEALVDRPERPRSELLDAIEQLRLEFEQARAARDRLTEGAEEAMARGHWTTGLFDMERAVAGLNPADEEERAEAQRLEERLEEARAQKRELEDAVRHNVELGNRYGMQQDDPASTVEDRLATLRERRTQLRKLRQKLPEERAQLYAADLRDVELHIALEQAAGAELTFDEASDVEPRREIATRTTKALETAASSATFDNDPPGRLLRQLEHWRTVVAACNREVETRAAEAARRARTRRRALLVLAASLVLSLSTLAWTAGPWLLSTVFAGENDAGSIAERIQALRTRVADLANEQQVPATALAEAVAEATAATATDALARHDAFAAALTAFGEALEDVTTTGPARSFANAAWAITYDHLIEVTRRNERAALNQRTDELAEAVAAHGIERPR